MTLWQLAFTFYASLCALFCTMGVETYMQKIYKYRAVCMCMCVCMCMLAMTDHGIYRTLCFGVGTELASSCCHEIPEVR